MNDRELIWESYLNIINENLGSKHLNPDGKRKARKELAYRKRKQEELQSARTNIIKIKNEAKRLGYVIKLTEHSYTIRKTRFIGLSKQKTDWYHKYRNLRNFHLILFVLAHEFGHVLQWDETTGRLHMFDFWFSEIYKATPELKLEIKLAETMYYELDAWDRARQFIPKQLYNDFLQKMKENLDTYKKTMTHVDFDKYPFIKELASKLNYTL
jgi:hypothetical protein